MGQFDGLRCDVRVFVHAAGREAGSMYGAGVAGLCGGVRERGSLRAAAKAMGMSYSKAWRIVRGAEEALGVKLTDSRPRGCSLTAEGERLLDAYIEIAEALEARADALLRERSVPVAAGEAPSEIGVLGEEG